MQIKVTVCVSADATDFSVMSEKLVGLGMRIESVVKSFGQIKGEIHKDRVASIVQMDDVNFVWY